MTTIPWKRMVVDVIDGTATWSQMSPISEVVVTEHLRDFTFPPAPRTWHVIHHSFGVIVIARYDPQEQTASFYIYQRP